MLKVLPRVFQGKRRLYSRKPAEDCLDEMFGPGRKMMLDDGAPISEKQRQIRTMCVACDSSTSHPKIFLFRNYLPTGDSSETQIDVR